MFVAFKSIRQISRYLGKKKTHRSQKCNLRHKYLRNDVHVKHTRTSQWFCVLLETIHHYSRFVMIYDVVDVGNSFRSADDELRHPWSNTLHPWQVYFRHHTCGQSHFMLQEHIIFVAFVRFSNFKKMVKVCFYSKSNWNWAHVHDAVRNVPSTDGFVLNKSVVTNTTHERTFFAKDLKKRIGWWRPVGSRWRMHCATWTGTCWLISRIDIKFCNVSGYVTSVTSRCRRTSVLLIWFSRRHKGEDECHSTKHTDFELENHSKVHNTGDTRCSNVEKWKLINSRARDELKASITQQDHQRHGCPLELVKQFYDSQLLGLVCTKKTNVRKHPIQCPRPNVQRRNERRHTWWFTEKTQHVTNAQTKLCDHQWRYDKSSTRRDTWTERRDLTYRVSQVLSRVSTWRDEKK